MTVVQTSLVNTLYCNFKHFIQQPFSHSIFFFLVKDNQIKYYTEYSNSLYKTIFAVVKSMTKLSISVPKCTIPKYLL